MHAIVEKYWEYTVWTKERSVRNSRKLMEAIVVGTKHRLGLSRLALTTVVVKACAALS